MKFHHSSKLMKSPKHATAMPPGPVFKALQTQNGHALLFSVNSDNVLYCICETPGSLTGWCKVDLTSKLAGSGQKIVVKTFDVAANLTSDQISLVIAATIDGKDHLYVSLGNNNADASWCNSITWVLLECDDRQQRAQSVVINNVFIKQTSGDYNIVADTLHDRKSGAPIIFRYYIDPAKKISGQVWIPHDSGIDLNANLLTSTLGRKSQDKMDGIYDFGGVSGNPQLVYTPLYNSVNPGIPPKPTSLKLPVNATAIAAAIRQNIFTDLYVAAGDRIYVYPYDKLRQNAEPFLVSNNHLFKITALHTHVSGERVYLWGLNKSRKIFYITGEADIAGWSYPVPILTSVYHFASYLNKSSKAPVVFANMSGKKLIQISRDPVTSLWQQRQILLPPVGANDIVVLNSYTTHIKITDDNNLPLPNATVNIRGTGFCSVYINNEYCLLSNDKPLKIKADETGIISILQEVNTIGAVCYHINSGDSTVDINPMNAVMDTIGRVRSADDLIKIKITDPDGNTRRLVPEDTSKDQVDVTARAIAQLVDISKKMPRDGSLRPISRSIDTTHEMFRNALTKTDNVWGITYHDDAWQYHDGDSLLKHLGFANGWPAAADEPDLPISGNQNISSAVAGDIFNWLKDEIHVVTNVIISFNGELGTYLCFVGTAERSFGFAIDCINTVAQIIEFIFGRIRVYFEDLIKWLGPVSMEQHIMS